MKKHLLTKLLAFLLFSMSIDLQANDSDNKHLEWQKQHFSELQEGIQNYLQREPLILLKAGPTALYLDENPQQIRIKDANHYITIIAGMFVQEENKLFALFFVEQQKEPYEAMPMLMYTCGDQQYMPSMRLYLDVIMHPFVKENYLSSGFRVHIDTLTAKEDAYLQEWMLYNEGENKKITIMFTADELGGTKFSFIES